MGKFDLDQFHTPPDPDLMCPICQSVLDDGVESPCHHLFCRPCIEKWLEKRPSCPTCRGVLLTDDLHPVVPMVRNMINHLQMKCPYAKNGCKKAIQLKNFETHVQGCGFLCVTCCHPRCKRQMLKKDVTAHERRCGLREVKCNKECQLMIPVKHQRRHTCMEALKERVKGAVFIITIT